MKRNYLKILQINSRDMGGGAEKIAYSLHQYYHSQHLESKLAVGEKISNDEDVFKINQKKHYNYWTRFWSKMANKFISSDLDRDKFWYKFLFFFVAQPKRFIKINLGHEFFDYPGTKFILNSFSDLPNIIHAHNLHGGYFDLRQLEFFSCQVPFLITLHDAWLLSGHCAHSFDCERWKIGCGSCPDLTIPPAVKQDRTNYNWNVKKIIYGKSKLYVASPSQWLMNKLEESILFPSIIESRIIPNGIDLSVFKPGSQTEARRKLNLPLEAKIILFSANGIKKNPWKDYKALREALTIIGQFPMKHSVIFLALGEDGISEKIGNGSIQFIPYNSDPSTLATYYQSADVFIHAAKAETFGLVITEALACGIPVIATNVGGIPEQVKHGETGFLVSIGDAVSLAEYITVLINNNQLRQKLSHTAAKTAQKMYSLEHMANAYLKWYEEIIFTNY